MSPQPRYKLLRESIELADYRYVLEQLVQYNSTVQSDQPSPVVDLHLTTGAVLRGTPFKMLNVSNRYLFALQTLESTRDLPSADVREICYVDSSHIVSLKVHEPMKWKHELSFGKAARPIDEEPLTRLNAKRLTAEDWAGAKNDLALQIDWDQFPQTGLENNYIRRLAKEVLSVISQLKADNLGREALLPVKSVRLVYSTKAVLEASLNDGTLSLTTDACGTNVSPANVKAALEAAL